MRTFGLICPGLVEIQVFEVSWVKFYGKRGKMSVVEVVTLIVLVTSSILYNGI